MGIPCVSIQFDMQKSVCECVYGSVMIMEGYGNFGGEKRTLLYCSVCSV